MKPTRYGSQLNTGKQPRNRIIEKYCGVMSGMGMVLAIVLAPIDQEVTPSSLNVHKLYSNLQYGISSTHSMLSVPFLPSLFVPWSPLETLTHVHWWCNENWCSRLGTGCLTTINTWPIRRMRLRIILHPCFGTHDVRIKHWLTTAVSREEAENLRCNFGKILHTTPRCFERLLGDRFLTSQSQKC